ncbi:hypothetical protein CCHL11_03125 [Colletotrichum chlorophyti]|uniref:Uncharacterized protein n=1 Tax=Colletotrichum chlorophyti TaxID=708187 RepID=A0A1Q8RG88_9PEZI|nr:hypothetical protein CCHL11_03125 [Colletotrichum chlorophyti]
MADSTITTAGPDGNDVDSAVQEQNPAARTEKAASIPDIAACGRNTADVLWQAICRELEPTDPQTRVDFGFDNLYFPSHYLSLLSAYKSPGVTPRTLNTWLKLGKRQFGEKVVARMKHQRNVAPRDYQFVTKLVQEQADHYSQN